MKHLDALYEVKKQGSGVSSRLIIHKVKKEDMDLMVDVLDVETCRKTSGDGRSSKGSKDGSGSKVGRGSREEIRCSKGSNGGSANPKLNRTTSKSGKGRKGQKEVAPEN